MLLLQASSHIRKPLHLRRKVRHGLAHAAILAQSMREQDASCQNPRSSDTIESRHADDIGRPQPSGNALHETQSFPSLASVMHHVYESYGGACNAEASSNVYTGNSFADAALTYVCSLCDPSESRRRSACIAANALAAKGFMLHELENHEGYRLIGRGIC